MRLASLADTWLDAPYGWSTGTERTYPLGRPLVKPALGQLCVREVTPGVVSRALAAIARSSGASAAKSTRACLSGMFAIANGASATNPVRDSVARISVGKKAPRALPPRETAHLTALSAASPRAAELDLVDVVDWMLATGCRISEALAIRYSPNADGKSLLDLEAGTWEVNATVVRVPRGGLVVQSRPKRLPAGGWSPSAVCRSDARAAWADGREGRHRLRRADRRRAA